MPQVGQAYYLSLTTPHTQLNTGGGNAVQSLVLDTTCHGLILSGAASGTNIAYITFDNSTPSSTNGLALLATSSPIIVPLGYNAHSAHTLKVIGSAASTVLNVVQLS